MKLIRRSFLIFLIATFCFTVTPVKQAHAVLPAAIIQAIKAAVKKVIKALDLMVQRLQNKTIALQNAQKILENKLSQLKLTEIAQWTEKHRKLFAEYYDELWKVKNAIASYQRVKDIIERQQLIVKQFKTTWEIVQHDKRFTEAEIDYMYHVYTGILRESARNVEQVLLVINSFKTQMSDAKRIEMINTIAATVDRNYFDLLQFNMQNYTLSINRSRTQQEINMVKRLYGFK